MQRLAFSLPFILLLATRYITASQSHTRCPVNAGSTRAGPQSVVLRASTSPPAAARRRQCPRASTKSAQHPVHRGAMPAPAPGGPASPRPPHARLRGSPGTRAHRRAHTSLFWQVEIGDLIRPPQVRRARNPTFGALHSPPFNHPSRLQVHQMHPKTQIITDAPR